jgi:hypothetical protein
MSQPIEPTEEQREAARKWIDDEPILGGDVDIYDLHDALARWLATREAAAVAKLLGDPRHVVLVRLAPDLVPHFAARTDGGDALSYRLNALTDGTFDLVVTRTKDGWSAQREAAAERRGFLRGVEAAADMVHRVAQDHNNNGAPKRAVLNAESHIRALAEQEQP